MRKTITFVCAAIALIGIAGLAQSADSLRPAAVQVNAAPAALPLSPAGEGRRAFLRFNCYGCHGMFAAGASGPDIIGAERGDVAEAVLFGREGGMPSFRGEVTDTDITNLSAYLRSIGTPAEPVFMDWWKRIPPK
jgi:cytochrome c551